MLPQCTAAHPWHFCANEHVIKKMRRLHAWPVMVTKPVKALQNESVSHICVSDICVRNGRFKVIDKHGILKGYHKYEK